jgi:hypothetical protein
MDPVPPDGCARDHARPGCSVGARKRRNIVGLGILPGWEKGLSRSEE